MGLYAYEVESGHEGRVTAESLPRAIRTLQYRGIKPARVRPMSEQEPWHPRLSEIEYVWLYRHLADLLESGVNLSSALLTLAQDAPDAGNSARLRTMANLVAGRGLTLSEAMALYPRLFGGFGIAVVRAAEGANRLPQCLRMMSSYLQRSQELRKAAMLPAIYPMIILIWMAAVVAFLTSFVVPRFLDLYFELGMTADQMPWATRATLWLSRMVPPLLVCLILLIGVLALYYWLHRKSTRVQLDIATSTLRLPLFGRINRDRATARVLDVLALGLEAGVPLPGALAAAGAAGGNELMAFAMQRASERARLGSSAAEALQAAELLPPALIWHVRAAEQSGNLVEACRAAAETYAERVRVGITQLNAALEPLLIILVGLCVGGVGTSLFMPLVGIISELSQ
ncbi:MAG TPA: hypothetical protein DGT21_23110 [Armatimonadetes bacterium]|jgi:type II secretory pathway component PulF|nr:hypothetical protein [Armatimonadota bacterium]